MDLEFSDEHRAFQKKVRDFIAENLPADIREKVVDGLRLERGDFIRWQDILYLWAERLTEDPENGHYGDYHRVYIDEIRRRYQTTDPQ